MDPEARRRACVAFRVKLSRDTGANLTATACESLLGAAFQGEGGEEVSLRSDPGLFYAGLGAAIRDQTLPFVLPYHEKIAWWCFREAAEVHKHPVGMYRLGYCYHRGRGVTANPAQASVWYHKAADLGHAASKAALGVYLLNGEAPAGVVQDTARGFALLREAVEQGYGLALFHVAQCYLKAGAEAYTRPLFG